MFEVRRGNFLKGVHRDVSRRGGAQQSKIPVVHNIGLGLRLGYSPCSGVHLMKRQVDAQLKSSV